MDSTMVAVTLKPCPFCKQALRITPSLAKSFSPPRPLVEYGHDNRDCLMGRWMRAFYDDEPEKFEMFADQWNDRIQSEGRTEAADEIASLRARVEAVETALVSEREDNLWHAYHSGHVRDGEWDHMCMSDGEWLAHECGFNVKDRRIADADIRAAIPEAARQALKDTP